jgi:sporulation integral membrane protein YtvI
MDIERKKSILIQSAYYLLIVFFVFAFFKYVLPIILPFFLGFVIAYLFQPLITKLSFKTRLKRTWVSFLVLLIFYAVLWTIIIWFGFEIVLFTRNFLTRMPELYNQYLVPMLSSFFEWLKSILLGIDPQLVSSVQEYSKQILDSLGAMISSLSIGTVGLISGFATKVPLFVVNFFITIIASFFIAYNYQKVRRFIYQQLQPKTQILIQDIKASLNMVLKKYILSQFVILSITFVELSIGLTILNVRQSLLIAFLIALLDILPVFGTGSVLIPWAIVSLVSGQTVLGFGLFALYIFITVIRNVIEPKIIGEFVGINPLLALFAMYVGARLYGLIGLFGLPILLAILKELHNNQKITLYKRHVESTNSME